jgi:hypothetical protein
MKPMTIEDAISLIDLCTPPKEADCVRKIWKAARESMLSECKGAVPKEREWDSMTIDPQGQIDSEIKGFNQAIDLIRMNLGKLNP